jgi:deoxyxylulose-5-phosphate synthase
MDSTLARALRNGGHPGGSYSTLRILEALQPLLWTNDFIMSSKGHDNAALLAWKGADPTFYRRVNGIPGHPERGTHSVVSVGSLGIGLSKAVGLAWSDRQRRVFCIVGDGECQEGQVWEAAQNAARLHLDNLIVIVDSNGAQSDNRPMPVPQSNNPDGLWKAACWSVLPSHLAEDGLCELVVPPGAPLAVLFHGTKDHPHSTGKRGPLVDAYSIAIQHAMIDDRRLVLLEADLAYDLGVEEAGTNWPDRVIRCGISEQHMVSMAVGLAASGWHPVCHTFSRFYMRAADQIIDALGEPGLAIRLIGGLAGPLAVGPGPSHEVDSVVESAVFRCRTFTPRTPVEVERDVSLMLRQPRSTYLRLLAQPDMV